MGLENQEPERYGIIRMMSSNATSPARQCSLAYDSAKGTLMPNIETRTPVIPNSPSAEFLIAFIHRSLGFDPQIMLLMIVTSLRDAGEFS
jgi:hypothetical protein